MKRAQPQCVGISAMLKCAANLHENVPNYDEAGKEFLAQVVFLAPTGAFAGQRPES